METDALITARHQALEGILDERQRRLHAAVEAKVLGHGGVKRVSEATGVARGSILAGIKELNEPEIALSPRQGSPGRWRTQEAGGSGSGRVDCFGTLGGSCCTGSLDTLRKRGINLL